MAGSIPDGWLKYTPMGKRIEGTRFIAFKVPLMGMDLSRVPEGNRLTPKLLLELAPDVGLIIDLTDTTRYYKPQWFMENGIEYTKLAIAGHILPPKQKHNAFRDIVDNFLKRNADNEKLIGVHCTHGCNRTGLMICSYLVLSNTLTAATAIEAFQSGRGHVIHRDNYIKAIKRCSEQADDKAVDSPGASTSNALPIHRAVDILPLHWVFDQNTQRNTATLVVEQRNLIPDGKGAYYVHVKPDNLPHRISRDPSRQFNWPQSGDQNRAMGGISLGKRKRRN